MNSLTVVWCADCRDYRRPGHGHGPDSVLVDFNNTLEATIDQLRDRIDALEAENERLKLALIEATNPGIDIEQVRQNREVMQAPGFRERARRATEEGTEDIENGDEP